MHIIREIFRFSGHGRKWRRNGCGAGRSFIPYRSGELEFAGTGNRDGRTRDHERPGIRLSNVRVSKSI
jgi:hypothetical protein